jgi:hypothetical protein
LVRIQNGLKITDKVNQDLLLHLGIVVAGSIPACPAILKLKIKNGRKSQTYAYFLIKKIKIGQV